MKLGSRIVGDDAAATSHATPSRAMPRTKLENRPRAARAKDSTGHLVRARSVYCGDVSNYVILAGAEWASRNLKLSMECGTDAYAYACAHA